jgi:hypothetical protein
MRTVPFGLDPFTNLINVHWGGARDVWTLSCNFNAAILGTTNIQSVTLRVISPMLPWPAAITCSFDESAALSRSSITSEPTQEILSYGSNISNVFYPDQGGLEMTGGVFYRSTQTGSNWKPFLGHNDISFDMDVIVTMQGSAGGGTFDCGAALSKSTVDLTTPVINLLLPSNTRTYIFHVDATLKPPSLSHTGG